ncbi:MAG: HlyD family efflux transporter periplasmic adaptor subunit [Pirellulales bacterium]|nr:HlyD family efflux transporter periplasmic adaptor subunit [Pirellulales bacterium]
MWNKHYIPTPWRRRFKRFCYRGVPILGFLVCATATFWLWQRQDRMPVLTGEVLAVRLDVTAGRDGVLVPLAREPWKLYDDIQAGQIIARLDDRTVSAQLDYGRKELIRIRADLEAAVVRNALAETDRDLNYSREATQIAVEHERLLLWLLEQKIELETNRLELQRCKARLEHYKPLHDKDAIPDLQWVEENLSRDIVAKRVEEGLAALHKAEEEERKLREQRERLPARISAESTKLLAPFQAAIESQQARIRELESATDQLIVRAPVDGVICAILHRPGENVRAGDPIVTVANPRGQAIISYVRQDQPVRPLPGMTAKVRLRLPAVRSLATRVERVGPQIEQIPIHLCRDPNIPEWGLPVLIDIPDGLPVRPGELLDVSFQPEGG